MEPRSPKDHGTNNDDKPVNPTPDENHDTLLEQMGSLSLSHENVNQEDSGLNKTVQSDHQQEQEKDQDDNDNDTSEDETSKTYRIDKFTMRRDSDDPDEEEQESSNLKPEELYDIVFNLDTPREVDLKVKIKGDFNVTILA
ncbi:hypothetical protein BDV12DRAFT_150009 [Aspergillus spectabilis]